MVLFSLLHIPQSTSLTAHSQIYRPIFRSYKPQDETNPLENADKITDIEAEVKTQLELMKTPIVIDEIDIVNLAPRKPDWDLKRDVSKKLEKLERRTQKAIAELIRDRLKKGQTQDDLLQAVNVASSISKLADNDE